MKEKAGNQTILTIAVLLVSFIALFVSIRQVSIMNRQTEIILEQAKANAWPALFLEMNQSYTKESITNYSLYISNKGTGPAIIEGVKVSHNESPVNSWYNYYKSLQVPDSIPLWQTNSNISGQIISANEELRILDLSKNLPLLAFFREHADQLSIEICYRSVFGDYWKITRTGFKTNQELTIKKACSECGIHEDQQFIE